MRSIFFTVFVFFLLGCQAVLPPETGEIKNNSGQVVGRAVFLTGEYGLTADHVWRTHAPIGIGDGELIDVVQRDRANDILVFQHAEVTSAPVNFKKKLVNKGEKLFWFEGQGVVEMVDFQTEIESKVLSGLILLTGEVAPGMSGAPVYDEKNKLVGIILGGGDSQIFVRPISRRYLLDATRRASKIADEI